MRGEDSGRPAFSTHGESAGHVNRSATLTNSSDEGQAMTLARIGIPAGLSPQLWQLKELRENGVIDFYETTPREIILYFRSHWPPKPRRRWSCNSAPISLI